MTSDKSRKEFSVLFTVFPEILAQGCGGYPSHEKQTGYPQIKSGGIPCRCCQIRKFYLIKLFLDIYDLICIIRTVLTEKNKGCGYG